jgi:hypothetical protein
MLKINFTKSCIVALLLLSVQFVYAQTPDSKTQTLPDTTSKIGKDLIDTTDNTDSELAELMGGSNVKIDAYMLQDLPDVTGIFPALSYFEDKDGKLSIQQVSSAETTAKFLPYGTDFRLANKDVKTYWLKMTLMREPTITTDWVFMFDKQIDLIELFVQKEGLGFTKVAQTGADVAYKERTLPISDTYQNYLPIKVYDKPLVCYIRIVCNPHIAANKIPLSPNILKMSDLSSISLDKYYPQGVYFGGMLLLILFNFGIFGIYQDRAKVWFIASLILTTCYQLALRGFFEKMFSFNIFVPLQQYFSFVFACLSIIVFAHFSRIYLRAREFMPVLDKVLMLFMAITTILMFTGLVIEYQRISTIINYLSPFSMLLILAIALVGIKREYQPAQYLFGGVLVTLFGSILYALEENGMLEPSLLTNNSLQIGELFLGLLVTIGLVVRLQRKNAGGKII